MNHIWGITLLIQSQFKMTYKSVKSTLSSFLLMSRLKKWKCNNCYVYELFQLKWIGTLYLLLRKVAFFMSLLEK